MYIHRAGIPRVCTLSISTVHESEYDSTVIIYIRTEKRYKYIVIIERDLILLAQRPITLVLMMINSCSYSTNDLVFN